MKKKGFFLCLFIFLIFITSCASYTSSFRPKSDIMAKRFFTFPKMLPKKFIINILVFYDNEVRQTGSGIIIDDSGVILTAAHIVSDEYNNLLPDALIIIKYDKSFYIARALENKFFGSNDIAFLKITEKIKIKKFNANEIVCAPISGEKEKFKAAPLYLGENRERNVFEKVIMMGYAEEKADFLSGRIINKEGIENEETIILDKLLSDISEKFKKNFKKNIAIAAEPHEINGMSGGPVLADDKVIGILSLKWGEVLPGKKPIILAVPTSTCLRLYTSSVK